MAMQEPQKTNKVLLMGKAQAGKTSMRSIIFANYLAKDTFRLGITIKVEHQHLQFLGNLQLNLWDCGGQDRFMENYFESQREMIFRNVEVLIYVLDIESLTKQERATHTPGTSTPTGLLPDLVQFQKCLDCIQQLSPKAKIFALLHKMDLITDQGNRQLVYQTYSETCLEMAAQADLDMRTFATSIWDETLFKAWSDIVRNLIPNSQDLETNLKKLCDSCQADEIVLFERATFLVVSKYTRVEQTDAHRLEKISNIVKQFKLRCAESRVKFQNMHVSNALFTAYIAPFTRTTNIMVIISDPRVELDATIMNIEAATPHFAKAVQV